MSEQIILALDPGEVVMGYCLGAFRGQQRTLIAQGDLRDVDNAKAVRWLDAILGDRFPHLLCIEDYTFQGRERSNNPHAFRIAKLVGALEGAGLMWSRRANSECTSVMLVSKSEANATLGLTGKCSDARIKRALAAVFPDNKLSNEHQRSAALVLLAGRTRSQRPMMFQGAKAK